MDKKVLFENAEKLLKKLPKFRETQTLTFESMDEKIMLKNIIESIYKVNADMGCPKCVIEWMNHLSAWYEREHPKYLATLEPVAEQSEAKEPEASQEPVSKPKRKKK